MQKKSIKAFTLVELIVVITILAILGTIAVISLQGYSANARDAVRISNLTNIEKWLAFLQAKDWVLPDPQWNITTITSSGSTVLIQWELTQSTAEGRLKMSGQISDPTDWSLPVYSISADKKLFQVALFLEVWWLAQVSPLEITHAADWKTLLTKWSKLWIILDETEKPVNRVSVTTIDLASTTTNYKVYLTDTEVVEWDRSVLSRVDPRSSCKRIAESWLMRTWKNKDWLYTVNFNWEEIQTYCSMSTDPTQSFLPVLNDADFEEEWVEHWPWATKSTEDVYSWTSAVKFVWAWQWIQWTQFIYIDPDKSYTLEWYFKSTWTTQSRTLFWFAEYDENFQFIANYNVQAYTWTDALLLDSVSSSDTVVTFTDSGWICDRWSAGTHFSNHATIAFDVDHSGQYNDLPNRNLSSRWFTSIVDNWDSCTLTLNNAVWQSYPSGTKIRMHQSWSSYNYGVVAWSVVPNTWTHYSWTISWISQKAAAHTSFRRWTKFVRVNVLPNYLGWSATTMLLDNFKLTQH